MIFRNIIKNLFTKKSADHSLQDNPKANNSIVFSIQDGYPTMSIYVTDIDDKSCDAFAEILFNIGEGYYQKPILDMIVSMSQKNPEVSDVLETILVKWGILLANTDTSEKDQITGQQPIIRPRNVFLGSK